MKNVDFFVKITVPCHDELTRQDAEQYFLNRVGQCIDQHRMTMDVMGFEMPEDKEPMTREFYDKLVQIFTERLGINIPVDKIDRIYRFGESRRKFCKYEEPTSYFLTTHLFSLLTPSQQEEVIAWMEN